MKYIVEKEWLKEKLGSLDLVVLDCRFSLGNPIAGENAYEISHIPGAFYCDLEKVLSSPVQNHGGRHPLPDLSSFQSYLEGIGVSNESVVVSYDDGESSYASRLWWLMKYIGHEEVYVLNGGFKKWNDAGFPVDACVPNPKKSSYQIHQQPSILATYDEVKKIVDNQNEKVILIDSRESKRYKGLEEPIDKVAGRIPGAINKFWNDGLHNGQFKDLEQQRERFSDLDQDENIIVYCGSGVTAVPNFLILTELGFKNLKLYVGSYSDWISYEENKIEKE